MSEVQPSLRIVTDEEIAGDGKYITMPKGSEAKMRKQEMVSGDLDPEKVLKFPTPMKTKPSKSTYTPPPSLGGDNRF